MSMRILILGGTGAMGTFLVKELAARGDEVFVTTRSVGNKQKKMGTTYRMYRGTRTTIFF